MPLYSFKYPIPRPSLVYYPSLSKKTYYSVPFASKSNSTVRNALIFYNDCSQVPCVEGAPSISEINVDDAIDLGCALRMPVVVVLSAHCLLECKSEIHEVYYAYSPEQAQQNLEHPRLK